MLQHRALLAALRAADNLGVAADDVSATATLETEKGLVGASPFTGGTLHRYRPEHYRGQPELRECCNQRFVDQIVQLRR